VTLALLILLTFLWAVIALLSVMGLRKKGEWTPTGRWFVGLVVLAIVVGAWQQYLSHRDEVDATNKADQTAKDASAAADSARNAAINAGRAAHQATLAAENAKQAAEEATTSSQITANLVGNVERTAAEVIRTAEPIESISLDIQFELPMSHPALAEYKKYLDRKATESYALKYVTKNAKGEPTIGTYGVNISMRGSATRSATYLRKKGVWFSKNNELFPIEDDAVTRSAVDVSIREIALFKRPIDLRLFSHSRFDDSERNFLSTDIVEPRSNPPDLAIHGHAPNLVDQIRVGWDDNSLPPHRYRAWIREWNPPISEWHFASDHVHYIGDLPGVQLLLVITDGKGLPRGALDILRQIEILQARLSINHHVLELSARQFKKRIDANGCPIWEFGFPAEHTRLFSPGV
jgi:hypothetical protein